MSNQENQKDKNGNGLCKVDQETLPAALQKAEFIAM